MKKATAIYARYSSHAQDGGTSIEVQLDACGRGLEPTSVREYVDRARTGRSVIGREALLRLLADAEAGQIDRVLVYKYDRIGRNLAETSAIIAQLEDSGLEVVSVTEGKDQLARGVQLVVAEHYSRALAERTRDGLMQRFKQHASTGGPPPYGYQSVEENGTKRRRVNEAEAAVVRGIFYGYLSGKGFQENRPRPPPARRAHAARRPLDVRLGSRHPAERRLHWEVRVQPPAIQAEAQDGTPGPRVARRAGRGLLGRRKPADHQRR